MHNFLQNEKKFSKWLIKHCTNIFEVQSSFYKLFEKLIENYEIEFSSTFKKSEQRFKKKSSFAKASFQIFGIICEELYILKKTFDFCKFQIDFAGSRFYKNIKQWKKREFTW